MANRILSTMRSRCGRSSMLRDAKRLSLDLGGAEEGIWIPNVLYAFVGMELTMESVRGGRAVLRCIVDRERR